MKPKQRQKLQTQILEKRIEQSEKLARKQNLDTKPSKGYMPARLDEFLFMIIDFGIGFVFFAIFIILFVLPIELTFMEFCLIVFIKFISSSISLAISLPITKMIIMRAGYDYKKRGGHGDDIRPILQWVLSILLTALIYFAGLITFILANIPINLALVIGLYLGIKAFVYLFCFFLSHVISKNALWTMLILSFFAFTLFFTVITIVFGGIK